MKAHFQILSMAVTALNIDGNIKHTTCSHVYCYLKALHKLI